jgi:hypothetical protein
MRRILWLLFLAGACCGAEPLLTLPASVSGDPGDYIMVPATTACKEVRWYAVDKGLKVFPVQLLKDSKTAVVSGPAGSYRLMAYTARGDLPSDPAICTVVIGTPGPTPGPTPPAPPVPPAPPIPGEGLRVLVVYETAELSKLPPGQVNALYSSDVRAYLNAKCSQGTGGARNWRVWDKDIDATNDEAWTREALKRPRQSLPWVVITNGTGGFEGPLPGSVDDTLALLKKFGG